MEIIGYLKKGFSSREIAENLNVTAKTVDAHRYNILKKLKLKNTAALVNFINQHNLGA
jgi:two-component system invasion response regulator UvrY